jgi:hypothetical protein
MRPGVGQFVLQLPNFQYKAAAGAGVCESCPAGSNSQTGSDAQEDCSCMTGYTGADGRVCLACVANSYKDTTGKVDSRPDPSYRA